MRASPEHRLQVFHTLKAYQMDNVGRGASVRTLADRTKLPIPVVAAVVDVLFEANVIVVSEYPGVYILKIPAPGVLPSVRA